MAIGKCQIADANDRCRMANALDEPSGYRVGRGLAMQLHTPSGVGVEPGCVPEFEVGDDMLTFLEFTVGRDSCQEHLPVDLKPGQPGRTPSIRPRGPRRQRPQKGGWQPAFQGRR